MAYGKRKIEPMSMTSHLNEEHMTAWCPACGETCNVYHVTRPATDKVPAEYGVRCPECGQYFYVSTEY